MEFSELEHVEDEFSGQNASDGDDDEEKCMETKRGGWTAFPFVIGSEVWLALAASGWSSNLIVYLITEFNLKNIHATQISNIVSGSSSLFPIAGAIIADSFFGSVSVVTAFTIISLLGMMMITLSASISSLHPPPCPNAPNSCENASSIQLAALYMGIALASLGSAGTGLPFAAMGANQFHKTEDQNIFFNWYFIVLYVSAAISSTTIVYLQVNVSWSLGFGICVAANATGLMVFILGKHYYRHIKPKGSPFISIARVIVAAIRKRKLAGTTKDYFYGNSATSNGPKNRFSFLNNAAMKSENKNETDSLIHKVSWNLCTVEEVEDVKTIMKIIPLWSSSIFVSTPIGMFMSLTILQALTMDRHLGPNFEIPASSFIVFNIISTSISLAILDRLIFPAWQKLTAHYPTPLQKLGLGHIINILAIVGSALIETRRLQVVKAHNLTEDTISVVPLSALWLVVPLTIIGIGEALHFPGQVAFYYQEFPKSLCSTSTAMMSLILAIGFYLSYVIIDLIRRSTGWLPDNINEGRLDYVFWIMAVVGLVNFMYYLICVKMFNYHGGGKLVEH